jgi:hypothetical protein
MIARASSSSSSSFEDGVVVVGLAGGRRAFLSSSAAAWVAAAVGCGVPAIANAAIATVAPADYAAVARDVAAIIRKDPNKGPTLVRLVSWLAIPAYSLGFFVGCYVHATSRFFSSCGVSWDVSQFNHGVS